MANVSERSFLFTLFQTERPVLPLLRNTVFLKGEPLFFI